MEVRVTAKGSIVLPAKLRRKLGIRGGTRIIITEDGDSILLKPITEGWLRKLQGSLKGTGAMKVLVQERRED